MKDKFISSTPTIEDMEKLIDELSKLDDPWGIPEPIPSTMGTEPASYDIYGFSAEFLSTLRQLMNKHEMVEEDILMLTDPEALDKMLEDAMKEKLQEIEDERNREARLGELAGQWEVEFGGDIRLNRDHERERLEAARREYEEQRRRSGLEAAYHGTATRFGEAVTGGLADLLKSGK